MHGASRRLPAGKPDPKSGKLSKCGTKKPIMLSDEEALSLVEFYGWSVLPQRDGNWLVRGDGRCAPVDLGPPAMTLREAIRTALRAQVQWASSRSLD
jgi:hypothetical protein